MGDQERIEPRALLEKQQEDILQCPFPTVKERTNTLLRLKQMLIDHEAAFIEALVSDMRRPAFEAFSFEIALLLNEIEYVCRSLKRWARFERSYQFKFGYIEALRTKRSPYGSVLIISPWNYPLQLALMPAISALAAGNRCVIKPSEYAPATSELLHKVVSQTFPPELVSVITGDRQLAKQLTTLPWDLVFFTGSQETGKAVSQQAAEQLTPVILELGGKNACILDETGFSPETIREIVWGKFLNAGQTCIAPDTLFVHESVYERTLSEISAALLAFYGEFPNDSKDYARICHDRHFQKLLHVIAQGKVLYGGTYNADDLFIAPTVLTDIQPGSSIMQEEIFGPVLPVIPYTDLKSLLDQKVIQRDALVAYVFSKNKQHIEWMKNYMRSTTVSVNQVIHHGANPRVAFGGVGRSGHGSYHGKAGFLSFSYEKTDYNAYRYLHVSDKFPPYSDQDMRIVRKFRKWLL
ncbi:aldehyde dehydrogenase family protein [Paenibacillus roseipurpureus]|uniref:Aldehyde dehydrogenase n=1 Tax=Paenibacillus roseopurpureus TaxID=2918901 RepID=A0AA96LQI4_9BACL|nr:aldehyde dehydrogenase family protein [Paenibacillus sp. MBLB1832]WNR45314.1 aldehyde dehydrogenase family protein [Paenibacillus sp. MBLB1832]